MAWSPPVPDPPQLGWWTEMKVAAEDREFRRWVERVATEVRAKRIERLRARVDKIDTSLARATLPADRRASFDRGYEQSVRSRGGDEAESWRGLPVEHSHHVGRVLSVRW
jgi:hypothetical protein